MSARVLVVDDIDANVRLLEARLSAEYFHVITATSGAAALEACACDKCDIVLLDVMMPEMDGLEVCRRLKADPLTAHLPVIMITALDQRSDRVAALDAGADDFLTKPINEIALITRVRSLVRLKALTDQLMMRTSSGVGTGLGEAMNPQSIVGSGGRVLLIEDRPASVEHVVRTLRTVHTVDVEPDPQAAVLKAAAVPYDLVMVSLNLRDVDGLRLCSQLRSLDRTRAVPILVVVDPGDDPRLIRALDTGVNDYLVRPIDRNEMLARVKTQVRRKRFDERLRDTVQLSMELAITDGLTGLHNRRYLERHLAEMVGQALARGRPLSVLVLDIDHFKSINDRHGHAAGDEVLREFSRRVQKAVRGIDLACRLGGEEFVVAMPDTDPATALVVGERICREIGGEPFQVDGGDRIGVTVSIGVSALAAGDDTPQTLLKRADQALYRAKRGGRNWVAAAA